jgi:hypothetical protein
LAIYAFCQEVFQGASDFIQSEWALGNFAMDIVARRADRVYPLTQLSKIKFNKKMPLEKPYDSKAKNCI